MYHLRHAQKHPLCQLNKAWWAVEFLFARLFSIQLEIVEPIYTCSLLFESRQHDAQCSLPVRAEHHDNDKQAWECKVMLIFFWLKLLSIEIVALPAEREAKCRSKQNRC